MLGTHIKTIPHITFLQLKKQKRKMKKMEKQLEQERLVRENQDSLDAIDSNPDKPTVKKVAFLDQEEGASLKPDHMICQLISVSA